MSKAPMTAYEAPEILASFDALEVIGSSEGLEAYQIGCGSQLPPISCLPA
jgi:hypothetical protein